MHVDEFQMYDQIKHFNQIIDHQKFIERKHKIFLDNMVMMEIDNKKDIERIKEEREKAGPNKEYWLSNRRDC